MNPCVVSSALCQPSLGSRSFPSCHASSPGPQEAAFHRRLRLLFIPQVIGRMCKIIDKTCLSPTPTLEQHLMWDDIAILARYMLMLSFNNSLDVAAHLPYLFHVVTLLVATGPLSLRASTHGLVINIIHSLCTCSQLNFSGEDTAFGSLGRHMRGSL